MLGEVVRKPRGWPLEAEAWLLIWPTQPQVSEGSLSSPLSLQSLGFPPGHAFLAQDPPPQEPSPTLPIQKASLEQACSEAPWQSPESNPCSWHSGPTRIWTP